MGLAQCTNKPASNITIKMQPRTLLVAYPAMLVGILLFLHGFLLNKVELETRSACSDHPTRHPCWTPPHVDRVVWIIIDALRYDFAMADAPGAPTSPHAGRLAAFRDILHDAVRSTDTTTLWSSHNWAGPPHRALMQLLSFDFVPTHQPPQCSGSKAWSRCAYIGFTVFLPMMLQNAWHTLVHWHTLVYWHTLAYCHRVGYRPFSTCHRALPAAPCSRTLCCTSWAMQRW